MSRIRLAALAAAALTAAPAAAHVTLEAGQAPANSTHRATFRVPHGCDGAAMTRLTVRLPEGVTQARPMPKAGWTIRHHHPRRGPLRPRRHRRRRRDRLGRRPAAERALRRVRHPPPPARPAGRAALHPRRPGLRGRPYLRLGGDPGGRPPRFRLPLPRPRHPADPAQLRRNRMMDQTRRLLPLAALGRRCGAHRSPRPQPATRMRWTRT
jgi:hypothetical protein